MPKVLGEPGTLEDLVRQLGGVPLSRILRWPPPGEGTDRDVAEWLDAANKRLCELIDGTLVEKPMGARESFLAQEIAFLLKLYNRQAGNPGMVMGPDGTVRIHSSLVRIPDVSFTRWDRLPGRRVPKTALSDTPPDLAVEVLSPANRPGEMKRKLIDYFDNGVRAVWFVLPKTESARVYRSATEFVEVPPDGAVDGGELLPGFRLSLRELFAQLTPDTAEPAPPPKPRRKKPRG